jgi:hypothetical protein
VAKRAAFSGAGVIAEDAGTGHEVVMALDATCQVSVHHRRVVEQHVPAKKPGANELAVAGDVVLDGVLAGAIPGGCHLVVVVLLLNGYFY